MRTKKIWTKSSVIKLYQVSFFFNLETLIKRK